MRLFVATHVYRCVCVCNCVSSCSFRVCLCVCGVCVWCACVRLLYSYVFACVWCVLCVIGCVYMRVLRLRVFCFVLKKPPALMCVCVCVPCCVCSHPWRLLTAAFWRKYPNTRSKHVKEVDVYNRYIDQQTGELVTHRVHRVETPIPSWLVVVSTYTHTRTYTHTPFSLFLSHTYKHTHTHPTHSSDFHPLHGVKKPHASIRKRKKW